MVRVNVNDIKKEHKEHGTEESIAKATPGGLRVSGHILWVVWRHWGSWSSACVDLWRANSLTKRELEPTSDHSEEQEVKLPLL